MFEAKLGNAALLKKIIEAIKDLVTDAPFDCSENAMCLQVVAFSCIFSHTFSRRHITARYFLDVITVNGFASSTKIPQLVYHSFGKGA